MTIFASGPKEDKLMSIAKMKKGFKKRFGILAIMLIIFGAMPALGATYSASGDHTTISALKPQAIIKLVSTNSGEAPLQVKVKDVSTGTVLYKKWYVDNEIVSRDQKQTELVRTFDNKGSTVEKHSIRLQISNGPSSSEDSCTIYVYPRNVPKMVKPQLVFNPAHKNNYEQSSRKAGDIRWIIIHDIEGSYKSGINTFKSNKSHVSAHYVISKDGEITQMVNDKDIAYHAGNYQYNKYSIGIELEGYAKDSNSFTRAQYAATTKLVMWLCQEYNIPFEHYSGSIAPAKPTAGKGIIGHYQVPSPSNSKKGGGKNGHTDPGKYFNWDKLI